MVCSLGLYCLHRWNCNKKSVHKNKAGLKIFCIHTAIINEMLIFPCQSTEPNQWTDWSVGNSNDDYYDNDSNNKTKITICRRIITTDSDLVKSLSYYYSHNFTM